MGPFLEQCRFEILDILHFSRKGGKTVTEAREFSVLSCRLSGEAVFFCNGEEVLASPLDFVFIPAGTSYEQIGAQEEIICLHLAMEGVAGGRITGFHCPSPHLRQRFIALLEAWQSGEQGYMLKCKGLIYDILFELNRISSGDGVERMRPVLAPAVEYMRAHYFEKDFSLAQAIAAAHVSPAYFRRVFKTVYGVVPGLFVNRLKIELAKTLLAHPTLTLREICERCGFLNEKYFFSVFKKITGTTPSQWRRAHL